MLAEEIERAIENRNRFRDPPFEAGWWLPVVFAFLPSHDTVRLWSDAYVDSVRGPPRQLRRDQVQRN